MVERVRWGIGDWCCCVWWFCDGGDGKFEWWCDEDDDGGCGGDVMWCWEKLVLDDLIEIF